jgi:hypothetical protein
VEVGGVETDGGDAGDFGAGRGLGGRKRINTENTEEESTEGTEKKRREKEKTRTLKPDTFTPLCARGCGTHTEKKKEPI